MDKVALCAELATARDELRNTEPIRAYGAACARSYASGCPVAIDPRDYGVTQGGGS